jgi:hypothetical protein
MYMYNWQQKAVLLLSVLMYILRSAKLFTHLVHSYFFEMNLRLFRIFMILHSKMRYNSDIELSIFFSKIPHVLRENLSAVS